MPDLNEVLNTLSPESTPEGDWNAPEAGSFPPDITPGTYTLLFQLPDDPTNHLDTIEVAGENGVKRSYLSVNFNPTVISNGAGQPVQRDDGTAVRLMFQRVSFYKHPKMQLSQGQELLRSLGIKDADVGQFTPQNIYRALAAVSGRATFKAEIGWRAYFKVTETTVSTHARTKKGQISWPRKADGTYEELATDPKSGEKAYGRAEIVRFKLPS